MIINGDCLEVMAGMEADSFDAIVTDPPYGLGFMGKAWDHQVPGPEFFEQMIRVAKPGAHLLAFGGTRLFHRMMVAIEDAGWEVRDTIMWVYGSGFPKSHDVSKAIDKAAGAEREVVGTNPNHRDIARGDYGSVPMLNLASNGQITAPTTDLAKQYAGWGTALKPAWEPIVVARKPLIGTVAANYARWGVGGLNIDQCRVEGTVPRTAQGQAASAGTIYGHDQRVLREFVPNAAGRWPSNLIHDGSDEVVAGFPNSVGNKGIFGTMKGGRHGGQFAGAGNSGDREYDFAGYGDSGSAARFFYCAKASKRDRDEGNGHPTVKPTELMRYLCRLVTPPGGHILDPFCGSGSTGKAATLEGFNFTGIELSEEYAEIARARIAAVQEGTLV